MKKREEEEKEFDKAGNVRASVSSLPNRIHLFMFAFLSLDTVNSTYYLWRLFTP